MMIMVTSALPYIDIMGELNGIAVWQIILVACKNLHNYVVEWLISFAKFMNRY